MAEGRYRAQWCKYTLDFNFEARTSRGSMLHKDTWFVRITDSLSGRSGVGEVPMFAGLSAEDSPGFERLLSRKCADVAATVVDPEASSIAFGFESAFASLNINDNDSTPWQLGHCGIPINGLVWMGDKHLMHQRIAKKLDQGYRLIKIKIGGISFADELDLIAGIRRNFSPSSLELRLDANGAFTPKNALSRLKQLAKYAIHSIEQPIRAGQIEAMAELCRTSPIPIALDEELIGMRSYGEKVQLVSDIKPAYLVLKPALCGGFDAAAQYISIAGPGRWWVTSALESNVGLYAIGRWLSRYKLELAQGLGTGMLYTNNISSPLDLHDCRLWCDPQRRWYDFDQLPWHQ